MENILKAYDNCTYWYDRLKEKHTRLRFNTLKYALENYDKTMREYMESDDYSEDESYLPMWFIEPYSHENDEYGCPADFLSDMRDILKE